MRIQIKMLLTKTLPKLDQISQTSVSVKTWTASKRFQTWELATIWMWVTWPIQMQTVRMQVQIVPIFQARLARMYKQLCRERVALSTYPQMRSDRRTLDSTRETSHDRPRRATSSYLESSALAWMSNLVHLHRVGQTLSSHSFRARTGSACKARTQIDKTDSLREQEQIYLKLTWTSSRQSLVANPWLTRDRLRNQVSSLTTASSAKSSIKKASPWTRRSSIGKKCYNWSSTRPWTTIQMWSSSRNWSSSKPQLQLNIKGTIRRTFLDGIMGRLRLRLRARIKLTWWAPSQIRTITGWTQRLR